VSDDYDGKHRKYPQPYDPKTEHYHYNGCGMSEGHCNWVPTPTAESNAQWVRDRIAEAGLTDEVEAAAIERVAAHMDTHVKVPVGPDGPAHPNELCVCCKASATVLRYDQHTEQLVCNDRDLCRDTMIFEHMLANVNGA
jgi:hypothetical protein